MGRRDERSPLTIPSWSGSGEVRLGPRRFHFSLLDAALAVAMAVALDISGFVVAGLLTAQTRIVCGADCFPSPQADLHDARVRLWTAGVIAVLTIGGAFAVRRGRVPVTVLQLALLAGVLIVAIPAIAHADVQLAALHRCGYGLHPPCRGVRSLGPP